MGKGRTGRIALVTLGVIVVGGAAGVATGKLSLPGHAWGSLASSVASTVASSVAALPSALTDRDEGPADAAAASAEALDAAPPRRQTRPLSSAQLGAPLVHGTFVSACGAPDDMKVVVKAAVKMGRAVDVTVTTDPPNPAIASCIERAAREMQWDVSPKVGHVTVRY